MIDWSVFRRAPVCLLRDTGDVVDADDCPVAVPSTGVILLSRALCRFGFLPHVASLAAKEQEDAALLHAEAHAPFASSDWVVVRSSEGFGVWWWDAGLVRGLIDGRTPYRPGRFVPESLGHAGATGWRQAHSADGYEAQYFEGATLRASSWRRAPFDTQQWRGFVNAVIAPTAPAPNDPPAPCSPGWPVGQPWLSSLVVRTPLWRRVERAGWYAAAASVAVATALMGHAARYQSVAHAYRDAIVSMQSNAAAVRVENRTAKNIDLAVAASSVAPLPEHLVAIADVMTAMTNAGVEPTDWSSNAEAVSVSGAGEPRMEEIASRLEQNPRLRNVEPFRVGDKTVIRAEIEPHRGALSDGAP